MQNMQDLQRLVYRLQKARDDYYRAFYQSQQQYQCQLSFNFSDFAQQNQEKQFYQQFFLNSNQSSY